jgi:hypothetical protein
VILAWASSTANWKALEDRYFNEVIETISDMERNKVLTREPALRNKSKNDSVRTVCRRLALVHFTFVAVYFILLMCVGG